MRNNLIKNILLYFVLIFFTRAIFSENKIILKYATVAPSGSLWARYIEKIKNDIENKSKGQILIKAYYSGVAGDESTMSKKLKAGLIDIAAFTGLELGNIVSDIKVMELPFFFDNYKQVDLATSALTKDMEELFDKKNLVFAGWGEGGFVYLLSKKPIQKFSDMDGMKIWAPVNEQIVKSLFMKYSLVPSYIGFESVLTQLQTGGLDAVYAPPMVAISMQWYQNVAYLTDLKLTCATGATLMNKSSFNKLPEDLKEIVLNAIRENSRALILELRKQNDEAMQIMKNKNINVVKMENSEISRLKEKGREVQMELSGKLYSKEILMKALNSLK